MNLRDYKWPRNPRGLHNKGVLGPFRVGDYTRPRMGWAKLVAGGNEFVGVAAQLTAQGCMPIVRIFRENMGALKPPEVWYENYREYIANGCYWFELYNEPNLEGEWPQAGAGPAVFVSYENEDEVVAPMMDNWIEWAERLIDLGGYPGFPAMADTPDGRHATIYWLDAFLRYLKRAHEQRFRRVIHAGLWCATHPYLQNHFYQTPPGGPATAFRPPQQQNAKEGGWHFEYPYDPLQQADDPGRTVFGGTALAPNGDTNGLCAAGHAFQLLLLKYFGAGPVPVVGTEGGIWRIPLPSDTPHLIDDRYPPYTYGSFLEATMATFEWISRQGPPWMWGVTLWKEEDYYPGGQPHEIINRMAAAAPILKEVPNLDTNSGIIQMPGINVPGGRAPAEEDQPEEAEDEEADTTVIVVSGVPDYHWLLLAPGLQADWFFQAARRYWQNFRPTVLTDWKLIEHMPRDKVLAITILARRDTIAYVDEQLRSQYPRAFYDALVYDTLEEMQAELDRRATYQRRFG